MRSVGSTLTSRATRNAGVDFHEGRNYLDGAEALAYFGQRQGLPGGDLDRARRQQNALRALLSKAASSGIMTDPTASYGFVDPTTRAVVVDETLGTGGPTGSPCRRVVCVPQA